MRRTQTSLYGLSVILLVTGVAMIASATVEEPASSLPTGTAADLEVAPDFQVELIGGGRFSLDEHLARDGRPVFLNFWASWCFPCRDEMPDIDQAAESHPDVFFLGIAVEDDPGAALAFAEEVAVDYPLAIDESDTVAALYPFFGLPTTWLIGSDGRIIQQVSGAIPPDLLEDLIAQLR